MLYVFVGHESVKRTVCGYGKWAEFIFMQEIDAAMLLFRIFVSTRIQYLFIDMKTSFADFYEQHYQRALLYVLRYVQDTKVAEDIVSESMIKLWQTMEHDEVVSAKALLYSILRSKTIDHLRREQLRLSAIRMLSERTKRELRLRIDLLQESPSMAELNQIYSIMECQLEKLSELTSMIFRMSRLKGISNKEIAAELGLSEKSVEYHIHKVLVILKKELQDCIPFGLLYFLFARF